MPVASPVEKTRTKCVLLILIFSFLIAPASIAQMRKLYIDNSQEDNNISKISFISPAEGYVAFAKYIGYTIDSGHTFTPRPITWSNVDYNGYSVNLTFGFGINGVKAFSPESLIVYGEYGLVPSILYSTNGGISFKLVFHSLYEAFRFDTWITDMAFPPNSTTGYAIDPDRILKTTNKGLSWTPVYIGNKNYFSKLLAVDNNNVYVLSENKILKTVNGGISWTTVAYPEISIYSAFFIDANKGWLNAGYGGQLYYTENGGATWTKKSEVLRRLHQLQFVSDSVGYSLSGGYEIWKTTDSGKVWEPLQRDNNYNHGNYGHEDIQFWSKTQFWAGGGQGFLEMTTNEGGIPYPRAYFKVDTSQLQASRITNLVNLSKPYYQHKWYKNDTLISTGYHTSYVHDIYKESDTIKLVVQNGNFKDSMVLIQYFATPGPRPIPTISSFTPVSATPGTAVTINGTFFGGTTDVNFGGTRARSFTVVSPIKIIAIVDTGSTGAVTVTTPFSTASLAGFTYNPPPVINSFTPNSGDVQTVVMIDGKYFNGATAVSFGGVAALSFTVESSSKITAVVGTGATGQLSVATPFGVATAPGFLFTSHQPVITGFEPVSGPVNTIVSINGYNFSTIPANNTVYFGAVKANVKTSTPTVLTVEVPVGATYHPINVTTSGLTAYSNLPFRITFPVEDSITANTFAPSKEFLTGEPPFSISIMDIDGDGSPEIATSNYFKATVSILKNKAFFDSIAFEAPVGFNTGLQIHENVFGDIDGDGKPDLVVTSWQDHSVRVSRNTSVPGTISFAAPLSFPTRTNPETVFIGDLDNDGRPDLAIGHSDGNDRSFRLSVLRNTSVGGVISFAPRLEFVSGGVPLRVMISDLDKDGWPDLIVGNSGDTSISVFKNTGRLGHISFAKAQHFAIHEYNSYLNIADYDCDGKIDIGLGSSGNNIEGALRNISTTGFINFEPIYNFPATPGVSGTAAADLSGDGKPELVTSTQTTQVVTHHNKSSTGNIAFGNRVELASKAWLGGGVALGDLDGDGIPDIAACNASNPVVSVFKNKASRVINIRMCATTADTVIRSNLTGTSFQWQQNTGSGFVNITDNATFGGTNTATLRVKGIQLNWNNYQYRCITNGKPGAAYKLSITVPETPAVKISTPDTIVCASSQTKFESELRNGTNTSYQWQVNDVNTGTNSPVFASNSLKDGDLVKLVAAGMDYCNRPFSINSNSISMRVVDTLHPTVDITATDTAVCQDVPVTFTASARNAGLNPTFHWQLNSFFNVQSSTDSTFRLSQPVNGTQVRVIVQSKMSCASGQAISRVIIMNVESKKMPMVRVEASNDTTCAGATVTFTANPTYGGTAPEYEWRKNFQLVGTGPTYATDSLVNGDRINVTMISNYECVSTKYANSNTINMVVGNGTKPTANISTKDTLICAGSQVSFLSDVRNGGSDVSYQWQVNGVSTGPNSTGFSSATLKNNDVVSLVVSGVDYCNVPFTVTSNTVRIRVAEALYPTVGITATDTTICDGSPVTFTASTRSAGQNPTFHWQLNAITTKSSTDSIFTTSQLTNGIQVRVIVESKMACTSSSQTISRVISMNVESKKVPKVTVQTSSDTICTGTTVTFTANPTYGGTTPTYQWRKNSTAVGSDNTYITNSLVNGDRVSVQMTSNYECATTQNISSNIIEMFVRNAMSPTIAVTGNTTVSQGQRTLLTATITGGGTSPVYQWQDSTHLHGWLNVSGATADTLSYTPVLSGAKVRCRLTSNAPCAGANPVTSTAVMINLVTGINPVPAGNYGVLLAPNPVSSLFRIDKLKLSDKWETLDVVGFDGKLRLITKNIRNQTQVTVDASRLSKGAFAVILRRKNGEAVYFKIIKM
jgi:photosystem II stability/assembly factor-like uncharacterized protein